MKKKALILGAVITLALVLGFAMVQARISSAPGSTTLVDSSKLPLTGGTLTGDLIVPNASVSSGIEAKSFNNILYADKFSGSDILARTQAAYNAAPASGSLIIIEQSSTSLPYRASTTLSINTLNKKALIRCMPGVRIHYTGANNTNVILYDPGSAASGAKDRSGHGVENCNIVGAASNAGQTGLAVGGTNGANQAHFSGNTFQRLGWGTKVDDNSYLITYQDNFFTGNSASFKFTGDSNAGENIRSIGNVYADSVLGGVTSPPYNPKKCVDLGTNMASFTSIGDSFDDCQFYVGPGSHGSIFGGHFEAPAGASIIGYDKIHLASSSTSTLLVSGTFFWQTNNSTTTNRLIRNGANLTLNGVSTSCSGCTPLTSFVSQDSSAGAGNTTINGIDDVGAVTTNCIDGGGACSLFSFAKSQQGSWTGGIDMTSSNILITYNGGIAASRLDAAGSISYASTVNGRHATNSATVPAFNAGALDAAGTTAEYGYSMKEGRVMFSYLDPYALYSVGSLRGHQFKVAGTSGTPNSGTTVLTLPSGASGASISQNIEVTGYASASSLAVNSWQAAATPGSLCYETATNRSSKNAALTCTVSARDAKTDIDETPALPGLDYVLKLNPVSFAYKGDPNRNRLGFIADEVAAVDKRLGDGYNSDGHPADEARSIDINAIVAVNTKAIQELNDKVDGKATISVTGKESSRNFTGLAVAFGLYVVYSEWSKRRK